MYPGLLLMIVGAATVLWLLPGPQAFGRVVFDVHTMLFGAAATRIPLTTLGILQYIAPIMQFALGVLVYHEAMPPMRWAGFGLVWLALVIMTWDALSYRRRTLALAATAPAPA